MINTHVFTRFYFRRALAFLITVVLGTGLTCAVNGHELWLTTLPSQPVNVVCSKVTPVTQTAIDLLKERWQGPANGTINLKIVRDKSLKADGYRLTATGVESTTENGLLYGAFEWLRLQENKEDIQEKTVNPSYQLRLLNHWDNLDGTIERGYAGLSIFWRGKNDLAVTEQDKALWREYAKANASLGINGTVLNNVNASADMLSAEVLQRVKAIADEVRPFGMKVYLSINFSSPVLLGKLETSDPLNKDVQAWWTAKVKEIYKLVPDFGGFLVKANSEGQPGPQDFGRTHADGANMLADALKPFKGVVMWRAFVYQPNDRDRAKQAYQEFMPLDGQFRENVIIQVKNGPVDFQPREPFSPLFGSMEKTPVMAELQITQEYLGHSHQLAYLAPMWEECLQSDTYQRGEGSTVAKCTDGSIHNYAYTAISGVANIGLDANWCGHIFAQSNWYAFGRLAWDNNLKSETIASEWLARTFKPEQSESHVAITATSWKTNFVDPVIKMMLDSREAVVNYMMPLGLHHQFAGEHHYGPGSWYAPRGLRADWTPPYYHKADAQGIGFDRSSKGTNAVAQYHEPLRSLYDNVQTCPENMLLWFHHLSWDYRMKSGRTLWDELCYKYDSGLQDVRRFQKIWDKIEPYVDAERFKAVQSKLKRQVRDAQVYKDGTVLYFQTFSKRPIPYELERPVYELDYLMKTDPLKINDN